MAGAIAHTFNNQLAAVIGNLELAAAELPKGEEAFNCLKAALQSAWAAAAVSGQMLGDYSNWPHVFLGKPYTLKAISEAIDRAMINQKK